MQSAPKELLKEYVQSQQFASTADIMQAMKEMFRDVIEQVMEVEMDDEIGRERCQRRQSRKGRSVITGMATQRRRSRPNSAR